MRKKVSISRADAMAALPVKAPVVKMENKGEKLYVTVEFERPGWQRVLGADVKCQRTFGLDAYGREVYDLCDGKHAVKRIVKEFAGKHHLSLPESEIAVSKFLKTLMSKGLVGMAMPKKARAHRE